MQVGYDLTTGIFSGSMDYEKTELPMYDAKLDGNYFVEDLLGGSHELKFGVEYRLTNVRSQEVMAGDVVKMYWGGAPLYARVYREGFWDYGSDRYSIYMNDAFSKGRLTLNIGFRLDREKSVNYESEVKASRIAPDLLPALTVPAVDPGLTWLTFSPRFGFTYDLTGDGKTIIRGNLARYGMHSPTWMATHVYPAALSFATFRWNDRNGDDTVTTDELLGYPTSGILSFEGFDPENPTALESPNGIDKNLKSPLTDEFILGVERELFPDFSLSANITLRRNHRFWWTASNGEALYDKETGKVFTQDDYIGPITGSIDYDGKTYDYEYWTLNQYRPAGTYMQTWPGSCENYAGFEIIATKRLSHRWMMSASFTYEKFNFHYGEKGYADPTNVEIFDGSRADWNWGLEWMGKLSFLYQLPWGFNVSCFANARQGRINLQRIVVPSPERGAVGLGGTKTIYIEKPGETRLPNFYNVDASLTKEFHLGNYGRLSLQVDAFNVFNFAHDLNRFTQVNSSRHDEIQAILNPRVIRFGIRYRF